MDIKQKLKHSFKSMLILMLALVLTFGATTTAFAGKAEDEVKELVASYTIDDEPIAKCLGKSIYKTSAEAGSNSLAVQTSDGVVLYIKDGKASNVARQIKSYAKVEDNKEDLNKIEDNIGSEPNLDITLRILEPISGIVATFIGIAVTLITLLMTVNTAFDIAYIAFPVLRNKMNDSDAMHKTNADGSKSLRIVTDEAQYAVEQATTGNGGNGGGGGNAMAIYFKKRIISYILLAIMLFILLTGNITLITDLALKLVEGLMDVLVEIAA